MLAHRQFQLLFLHGSDKLLQYYSMLGVNKDFFLKLGNSIQFRTTLELSAVGLGFYLGGIVGIGTLLYAIGIGCSVSLGLFLVGKFYK